MSVFSSNVRSQSGNRERDSAPQQAIVGTIVERFTIEMVPPGVKGENGQRPAKKQVDALRLQLDSAMDGHARGDQIVVVQRESTDGSSAKTYKIANMHKQKGNQKAVAIPGGQIMIDRLYKVSDRDCPEPNTYCGIYMKPVRPEALQSEEDVPVDSALTNKLVRIEAPTTTKSGNERQNVIVFHQDDPIAIEFGNEASLDEFLLNHMQMSDFGRPVVMIYADYFDGQTAERLTSYEFTLPREKAQDGNWYDLSPEEALAKFKERNQKFMKDFLNDKITPKNIVACYGIYGHEMSKVDNVLRGHQAYKVDTRKWNDRVYDVYGVREGHVHVRWYENRNVENSDVPGRWLPINIMSARRGDRTRDLQYVLLPTTHEAVVAKVNEDFAAVTAKRSPNAGVGDDTYGAEPDPGAEADAAVNDSGLAGPGRR